MRRQRLVTADEAAKAANVTRATLRDWVRRGLLTSHGSSRQPLYDIDQLMRAHQAPKPRRQSTAPLCGRCGQEPVGYATINDLRYCHGDEQRPSCYELTQRGEVPVQQVTNLLTQLQNSPETLRQVALFRALNARQSAARTALADPLDSVLRELTEDVVYFLAIGHLVKIGHSRRLRDRLKAMGLTSSSLLAIELGGRDREQQIHQQFARDRVTGELFKRSPALLAYIASKAPRVSA